MVLNRVCPNDLIIKSKILGLGISLYCFSSTIALFWNFFNNINTLLYAFIIWANALRGSLFNILMVPLMLIFAGATLQTVALSCSTYYQLQYTDGGPSCIIERARVYLEPHSLTVDNVVLYHHCPATINVKYKILRDLETGTLIQQNTIIDIFSAFLGEPIDIPKHPLGHNQLNSILNHSLHSPYSLILKKLSTPYFLARSALPVDRDFRSFRLVLDMKKSIDLRSLGYALYYLYDTRRTLLNPSVSANTTLYELQKRLPYQYLDLLQKYLAMQKIFYLDKLLIYCYTGHPSTSRNTLSGEAAFLNFSKEVRREIYGTTLEGLEANNFYVRVLALEDFFKSQNNDSIFLEQMTPNPCSIMSRTDALYFKIHRAYRQARTRLTYSTPDLLLEDLAPNWKDVLGRYNEDSTFYYARVYSKLLKILNRS